MIKLRKLGWGDRLLEIEIFGFWCSLEFGRAGRSISLIWTGPVPVGELVDD